MQQASCSKHSHSVNGGKINTQSVSQYQRSRDFLYLVLASAFQSQMQPLPGCWRLPLNPQHSLSIHTPRSHTHTHTQTRLQMADAIFDVFCLHIKPEVAAALFPKPAADVPPRLPDNQHRWSVTQENTHTHTHQMLQ